MNSTEGKLRKLKNIFNILQPFLSNFFQLQFLHFKKAEKKRGHLGIYDTYTVTPFYNKICTLSRPSDD